MDPNPRIFSDSSALRDRAFFCSLALAYICGRKKILIGLYRNFILALSLDKTLPLKFRSDPYPKSGSGLRIRIPDPDRIRLGGGLRSPSTLVRKFCTIKILKFDQLNND